MKNEHIVSQKIKQIIDEGIHDDWKSYEREIDAYLVGIEATKAEGYSTDELNCERLQISEIIEWLRVNILDYQYINDDDYNKYEDDDQIDRYEHFD